MNYQPKRQEPSPLPKREVERLRRIALMFRPLDQVIAEYSRQNGAKK
jgi:hypothetical protein